MDISSDEEAWVEDYWPAEHLIDITDYEGDIFEAYLDEDEADTPFPEAGMDQSFTTTMDDGEISEAKVCGLNFESQHCNLSAVPRLQPHLYEKHNIPEWMFLIINILTELLSAAFDQLSAANKPRYALIAMLMSSVAAITCIIELAYKAGKERVIWRSESKLPWFYHSSPNPVLPLKWLD
ncbi:hypothetical protein GOBAR_AA31161 [Gossypium barbadense]|uniref:Uncharacterized protein n=1 Tax=Gossypium barbadense TaxID=3634 RepID=A0A2P5WEL3_GOSBA|nr:hypothetical protein GOBAR_AA31161 [Gossypium barbadense]